MEPHFGQPTYTSGARLAEARAAMIMLHGRYGSATGILELGEVLNTTEVHCVAPEAAGQTWYPQRFIMPIEMNEPYLSSALFTVGKLIENIEQAGIPPNRIFLLGFSQGACLSLEYAARHAQKYGGVFALSGGLIGSEIDPSNYSGSFHNTPVLLGCSDIDAHIPLDRVQESTKTMEAMGAQAIEKIYPGMGHTINQDEIDHINDIIEQNLQS